ncbi:MAG: hypothetical protein ACRDAI_06485 [Candidatus Rhabdochlamydia sp.]
MSDPIKKIIHANEPVFLWGNFLKNPSETGKVFVFRLSKKRW